MENHPIPQDVTGFQFRLIGSLTVKQFGFLAAGTILAVIFWYLPIPLFIKAPLVLLCAGSGTAIAFVPLEGRPLDVMLGNFIKDLFTPNQYIYQKIGGKLPISKISFHKSPIIPLKMHHAGTSSHEKSPHHDNLKEKRLKAFLNSVHTQAKSKLDEKEADFLKSVFSGKAQIITMDDGGDKKEKKQLPEEKEEQIIVVENTPEQQELTLEKEAIMLQQALRKAQQEEQTQHTVGNAQLAHQNVLQLQQQLQEVLIQKQKLEQELLQLRKQLIATNPQVFTPSVAQPPAESQNVRKIPVAMAKSAGFPSIPDTPNVLVGIVKDARGNVLPNILLEVRDKDGNPVRAFKTNGLGQFASATSLNNGTYTVEFEDPKTQHQFDTFELIVKGEIISPIEIISHDAREALRKELFS